MVKQSNPALKNNLDYSEVDLEAMPKGFIPRTGYQPARSTEEEKAVYRAEYTQWWREREVQDEDGETRTITEAAPALDFFRVAWRRMAAPTGFRTLYPAIIPPGTAHVNPINIAGSDEPHDIALMTGFLSSILSDFWVRTIRVADILSGVVDSLPLPIVTQSLKNEVADRALRLNCLTSAYADLWREVTGTEWARDVAYRTAVDRRQALVELDALGAIALGVSVDDLCTIYRTTFPVMRQYERKDRYDAAGRLVPAEIVKLAAKRGDETGASLTEDERTWVHPQSGVTYVAAPPFVRLDREADMRAAYARFEHLGEGEADG